MKKPNLFILGAPKCGTTSLAHYLAQHPQIFFCPEKEPHYFNTDSNHRYYFDESSYLNIFKGASENHEYLAEGSVWYLYSREAVKNILEFNPNSKFVVMLRNPSDMFFSLHQELLYGGTENVFSPKLAWELQDERKQGKKIPVGCSDERFLQYEDACSLGVQLKKLLEKIDSNNLFIITMDELKNNPDAVYLNLLNFLNIEEISLDSYAVVNIKKVRRSYIVSSVLKYINLLKLQFGIKGGFGMANKINKINTKSGGDLNFDEEKIQLMPKLKNVFKKDIELLQKVSNKDLSKWL